MKLLLDFFPIVLFFAAFKIAGIFVATAVAMAATLLQIGWLFRKQGHVEPMHWVSLFVIAVFGGATLLTQDETFIKWKPTILYWLMGSALLLGHVLLNRNFLRQLMGDKLSLPDQVWRTLMFSWSGFFLAMGGVNLWVAYHFDTDTWVNFKLFGGMGLMLLFVLAQAVFLSRHVQTESPTDRPPAP
ncbi:MAG: septation protein A [Betaproteobacteria bacterium]|nr:septation protein A [Betaproteobacteria bacterium]